MITESPFLSKIKKKKKKLEGFWLTKWSGWSAGF